MGGHLQYFALIVRLCHPIFHPIGLLAQLWPVFRGPRAMQKKVVVFDKTVESSQDNAFKPALNQALCW